MVKPSVLLASPASTPVERYVFQSAGVAAGEAAETRDPAPEAARTAITSARHMIFFMLPGLDHAGMFRATQKIAADRNRSRIRKGSGGGARSRICKATGTGRAVAYLQAGGCEIAGRGRTLSAVAAGRRTR